MRRRWRRSESSRRRPIIQFQFKEMEMSTYKVLGVLIGSVVFLTACDKRPDPLAYQAEPAASSVAMPASTLPDPSVPAAETALKSPPAATVTDGNRTNGTLSNAQESNAMPMAGQVNDHSAPLAPEKGASAR
jgi:hypothetical protein